jgi:Zn-dependent protease with chaperone function
MTSAMLGDWVLRSLWQGSAVAAVLVVALSVLRRPEHRHAASLSALIALVVWPMLGVSTVTSGALAPPEGPQALLGQLWSIGATLCALRVLVGHARIEGLRRRGVRPPPALAARFDALRASFSLPDRVGLLLSPDAAVPLAIGVLRPAVLLPPALLLKLSVDQVDALLAHELAHLRRLDPLIAALQGLVEAVYFFHPAAWWISAQVRAEREFCCDRAAATRCGDPIAYARALAALAEVRLALPAPAADGGPLMDRIRTLVDPRPPRRRPVGAAVLLLALGLVSAAWAGGEVSDADGPAAEPSTQSNDAQEAMKEHSDVHGALRADAAELWRSHIDDANGFWREQRAMDRAVRAEALEAGREAMQEAREAGRTAWDEAADVRREALERGRELYREGVADSSGVRKEVLENAAKIRAEALEEGREALRLELGRAAEVRGEALDLQREELRVELDAARKEAAEAREELLAWTHAPARPVAPHKPSSRLRATAPTPPGMKTTPPQLTMPLPPLPPMPPTDASFSMLSTTVDGEQVVLQQHLVGDRADVVRKLRALVAELEGETSE